LIAFKFFDKNFGGKFEIPIKIVTNNFPAKNKKTVNSLQWLQVPLSLFQYSGNMFGGRGKNKVRYVMDASRHQPRFGEVMAPSSSNYRYQLYPEVGKIREDFGGPVAEINGVPETLGNQEAILKIPEFKRIPVSYQDQEVQDYLVYLKPPMKNYENYWVLGPSQGSQELSNFPETPGKAIRNPTRKLRTLGSLESREILKFESQKIPCDPFKNPGKPCRNGLVPKKQKPTKVSWYPDHSFKNYNSVEKPLKTQKKSEGFKDFKPSPQIPYPGEELEYKTVKREVPEIPVIDPGNLLIKSEPKDPLKKIGAPEKSRPRPRARLPRKQQNSREENFQYESILENAKKGKPSIFLDDPDEAGYYVGDGELIRIPMMTKLLNYFLK
jgi:hypothetical protein